MKEYRRERTKEGRSEATCNREVSILRTALNLGGKCTPPKVNALPYFPMVREENTRQGFLTDEQRAKLRDTLPDDLKPLFVTAYFTGVRLGELLAWEWDQVDWKQGFVTLNAGKQRLVTSVLYHTFRAPHDRRNVLGVRQPRGQAQSGLAAFQSRFRQSPCAAV